MIVAGGEACFALAMEWRLWHGRQAYRASLGKARFPPNCDVHGCDPLCPLYVDSSRPVCANTGHSPTLGRRVNST
jgi:hypothetical protein